MASPVFDQVYKIVCRIPKGKVLTYGIISALLEKRLSAQGVGWAMQNLLTGGEKRIYSTKNVPWHRVINSRGGLSTHKNPDIPEGLQKNLLEQEGVVFAQDDTIDLKKYLWREFS